MQLTKVINLVSTLSVYADVDCGGGWQEDTNRNSFIAFDNWIN